VPAVNLMDAGNNDFVLRDSKLQFVCIRTVMPLLPAKQTYHQRTNLALLVQVQIPLIWPNIT